MNTIPFREESSAKQAKNSAISLEYIAHLLEKGWSEEEIIRQYPDISHTDIQIVRHSMSVRERVHIFVEYR